MAIHRVGQPYRTMRRTKRKVRQLFQERVCDAGALIPIVRTLGQPQTVSVRPSSTGTTADKERRPALGRSL